MDLATVVGLVVASVGVFVGMILKDVSVAVLWNPAALLIIIVGTIGAVMIATPLRDIKKVGKYLKIIFTDKKTMEIHELIEKFTELSEVARKDGLLALEAKVNDIEDEFMKSGLMLAIDGQSPEFIRDVLDEEVGAMEERHSKGATIFSQAGSYAPTLGVLGAVIGLIAALSDLSDTGAVAHAIAAAFVATFYGIFTGYVLYHPWSNKLKQKSAREILEKQLIIEGILSVLEGQPPRLIEQKLRAYLPSEERRRLNEGK